MDKSTVTLLLGITFGFGVVALALTLLMFTRNSQPTVVLANGNGTSTYKNEERWSVVKDKDGRVRDIVVHREATQS